MSEPTMLAGLCVLAFVLGFVLASVFSSNRGTYVVYAPPVEVESDSWGCLGMLVSFFLFLMVVAAILLWPR